MALPFEVGLAQRNLARHPWHTSGMILGLALAVLVMIYIPSTMSSFYDDLIERAVERNAAHITIWPHEKQAGQMSRTLRCEFGTDAIVSLADRTFPRRRNLNGHHALMRRVESVPGIVAVACFVRGNATVSRGKVDLGIVLEGVEPRKYSRVVSIANHFPENVVPKLGPADVAIGFRMAEKLGLHQGEHVRIATAESNQLMRVKAIFRSGYYDKDLHHAFVSLKTAQRLFRMGNEVSALAARCWELRRAEQVSAVLVGRFHNKIRNWMDDNASLLAQIATVNRITLFIDVLVALVVSVGMANVFNMFVHNRQKELAIMRAMGASRLSLRTVLFLEAAFIWAVGAVIGWALALGVIAYEQAHPHTVSAEAFGVGSFATQAQPFAFVLATALAAATMIGSAWWSGRRAARLNPVEVIFGR